MKINSVNPRFVRVFAALLLGLTLICLGFQFLINLSFRNDTSIIYNSSLETTFVNSLSFQSKSSIASQNVTSPINGSEWQFDCEQQQVFIQGSHLVDENSTIVSQKTLTLIEAIPTEKIIYSQLAGRYLNNKGYPTPDSVSFSTDTGEELIASQPFTNHLYSYSFITRFLSVEPVTQITATVNGSSESKETARGFIVYYTKDTHGDLWTSKGRITNQYVYKDVPGHGIITETITIPNLQAMTDIHINAVIVDYNNDDRQFVVSASAGNVSNTITPSNSIQEGMLNFIDIYLSNVPTNTNQVDVTLHSPQPDGDSVVLAGINISHQCIQDNTYTSYIPSFLKPLILPVKITQFPKTSSIGLPLTYTITVQNPTNIKIENLELLHKMPTGIFKNLSISQPCAIGYEILCQNISIDPFGSYSVSISGSPTVSGTFTNQSTIYSTIPQNNVGGKTNISTNVHPCMTPNQKNDNFSQASGSILLNFAYCGILDDANDYYMIELDQPGNLIVDYTTNLPNQQIWVPVVYVQIYSDTTAAALIAQTYQYNDHLVLNTPVSTPGTYYIRIYAKDTPGFTYTLVATHSP